MIFKILNLRSWASLFGTFWIVGNSLRICEVYLWFPLLLNLWGPPSPCRVHQWSICASQLCTLCLLSLGAGGCRLPIVGRYNLQRESEWYSVLQWGRYCGTTFFREHLDWFGQFSRGCDSQGRNTISLGTDFLIDQRMDNQRIGRYGLWCHGTLWAT